MPELPEVEVLVRHLRPLVRGKIIRRVQVRRLKVLGSTSAVKLKRALSGATFEALGRRGKYLLFTLRGRVRCKPIQLLGHLGMTGRMFLSPAGTDLPKHAAVVLDLGRQRFIYEDTRYFGRFTLDVRAVADLGPEPLSARFNAEYLQSELARSRRPVKVKLLDQKLVAGVGNIYASEALFLARISPRARANRLNRAQITRLIAAIRKVLTEAIRFGSTIQLNHGDNDGGDGLFYFGRAEALPDYYEERLRVYDRMGQPCRRCRTPIRRIVQAARSTFYCPKCQAG